METPVAKLDSSDLGVQTMQSLRWVDADGSLVLVCCTATQVTTFRGARALKIIRILYKFLNIGKILRFPRDPCGDPCGEIGLQ